MRCVSSRSIFILIKPRSWISKPTYSWAVVNKHKTQASLFAGSLRPNIRLEIAFFRKGGWTQCVLLTWHVLVCHPQHLSRKFNKAYLSPNFDAAAVIHCVGAYCGRLCEQYELAHVESLRPHSQRITSFFFFYWTVYAYFRQRLAVWLDFFFFQFVQTPDGTKITFETLFFFFLWLTSGLGIIKVIKSPECLFSG